MRGECLYIEIQASIRKLEELRNEFEENIDFVMMSDEKRKETVIKEARLMNKVVNKFIELDELMQEGDDRPKVWGGRSLMSTVRNCFSDKLTKGKTICEMTTGWDS